MSGTGETGTERRAAGERRAALGRRIRWTARATIAWNAAEAVVGVTAGTAARSGALAGFGLDSVIELCSALALGWQFAGRDPADRERRTLRLVACSFLCLAVVLVVGSVQELLAHRAAATSGVGVTLAALSLVVMPSIAAVQRHAGRELGSVTAVADSRQGLLCAAMAAALLVGSGAQAALGWWWADPGAALLIGLLALCEGVGAWQGDSCCAPPRTAHPAPGATLPLLEGTACCATCAGCA